MEINYWKVKGYNGVDFTKNKLDNDGYSFAEIKEVDSKIVKQIEKCLEDGGYVFGLHKNKIVKSVYIFKLSSKGKQKILVFDKKIVLDEVNKCVKEFESDIDDLLVTLLDSERIDINMLIWENKTIDMKERYFNIIKVLRFTSWFAISIFSLFAIIQIILCSSFSMVATTSSIDEIKVDEDIKDFVHDINDYDYYEVNNVFSEIDNKKEFLTLEIILPTVFEIIEYVFFICIFLGILDLLKNVSSMKDLFTIEKYKKVKMLHYCFVFTIFLIGFLEWILLEIVSLMLLCVFSHCVRIENK